MHKKTVNDFVFISKGSMTKTIGLESFSQQVNQFLFTPKNSITTTQDVSEDLEGFYCHFSDDFIASNPFLRQWDSQPTLQNLLQLKTSEISLLFPLLERMAILYRAIQEEPQNQVLIRYYLATFIAEISLLSERKASKNTVNPLFVKFQQLVNTQFKTPKSVLSYADSLHVSPNHCVEALNKDVFLPLLEGLNALEVVSFTSKKDITCCKKCKKGRMITKHKIIASPT